MKEQTLDRSVSFIVSSHYSLLAVVEEERVDLKMTRRAHTAVVVTVSVASSLS